MGCINSKGQFGHWFGNIHFSGPCNRSCYFCIGQHMMALDPFNNLNEWPLANIDTFVTKCVNKGISEINVTGSNTDPLLFNYMHELRDYLKRHIPDLLFGVRTNGVLIHARQHTWSLFDKGSISITTLDPDLYKKTMGQGLPPYMERVMASTDFPLKANIVMCPETVTETDDWMTTIKKFAEVGIDTINLREPYGQPRLGNPFTRDPDGDHLGMPFYMINGAKVTYWDVHYVEVESVNLYANGRVSETYPVTEGCSETGVVLDQTHFATSGRVREQWIPVTAVS